MKMHFVYLRQPLFLTFLVIIYFGQATAVCTNLVCCPDSCHNCTICLPDLFGQCCEEDILNTADPCQTTPPPCVLTSLNGTDSDDKSILDKFISFFEGIYQMLGTFNTIVIIISFFVAICCTYSCCCFDKRKPAIPYEKIPMTKFKPPISQ